MAAGAWRNWTQGELVTEALFQDIQDSIAFIFASESAANTALTSKIEGTQFYDTGEDKLKIWNGSAWDAVAGGKVLQVVQGTFATQSSTTSTSASDTGLSVAITPSATSSKILIMMLHHVKVQRNTTSANGDVLILRDSTTIETSNYFITDAGGNAASSINLSASVLDSPSTTSAITYKTQFRVGNGTDSETILICFGSATDRLIAMEIGA